MSDDIKIIDDPLGEEVRTRNFFQDGMMREYWEEDKYYIDVFKDGEWVNLVCR